MGSKRPFGIDLESIWEPCGLDLASIWNLLGSHLGCLAPFLGKLGPNLIENVDLYFALGKTNTKNLFLGTPALPRELRFASQCARVSAPQRVKTEWIR